MEVIEESSEDHECSSVQKWFETAIERRFSLEGDLADSSSFCRDE